MRFTKMHGLGNDFIMIDCFEKTVDQPEALSIKMCDRRFGVGGDGLVLILPSDKADFKMRIFNPDGTEPEMCGNAIRCFAKYVYEKGLTQKTEITVETLAGILKPKIELVNQFVDNITVNMGPPRLKPEEIPFEGKDIKDKVVNYPLDVDGKIYNITCVSMGNPHCVIFVENLDGINIEELGKKIEHHKYFPRKTNVEFIEVIDKGRIKLKVWERGAGATLACGTGACASVVAGVLNDITDAQVNVELPGGKLFIQWKSDAVYMSGPALEVFKGEF
jgi:diaminopimelate epimerase